MKIPVDLSAVSCPFSGEILPREHELELLGFLPGRTGRTREEYYREWDDANPFQSPQSASSTPSVTETPVTKDPVP